MAHNYLLYRASRHFEMRDYENDQPCPVDEERRPEGVRRIDAEPPEWEVDWGAPETIDRWVIEDPDADDLRQLAADDGIVMRPASYLETPGSMLEVMGWPVELSGVIIIYDDYIE